MEQNSMKEMFNVTVFHFSSNVAQVPHMFVTIFKSIESIQADDLNSAMVRTIVNLIFNKTIHRNQVLKQLVILEAIE